MKSLTLILALVATSAQPATIETDRRELVQLAERMDYAWTSGDPDANAALFATDATAKFGTDPLSEGRGAIRAQFQEFFQDRPAGLRHVTRIERVERLTPDLALWDAEVRVEGRQAAGGWMTISTIRNVTVAVRQKDGWRVKSVRAFPLPQATGQP